MAMLRINDRDIGLHKATISPILGSRTVLTNSHWEYVALWLRREHKEKSLFYWQQAQTFAQTAENMPVSSAPLLHYYSFMNATKALLSAKSIPFDEHHGVKAHNMRGASKKIALSNEGVRLLQRGIAPALSTYLQEAETINTHSLEDLLFNIPYVHRTFCLTFKNQKDMFIPLTDCHFEIDPASNTVYFTAMLSKDFAGSKFLKRLPSTLVADTTKNDGRSIRSVNVPVLANPSAPVAVDLVNITNLMKELRPDINYIAGTQTLWYAKSIVSGPKRLKRSPLTCSLIAMHRLSEICRYRPIELASFLNGQRNWLLTEFIRMSPSQFLDEISAELTGQQFMIPNVRPAN
ncbi:MAG: hypothetical protein KF836_06285 [Fimbriimonadaceae bacterium]|nr:hypothetical protein [Fimbriimonadaceae bacterium]